MNIIGIKTRLNSTSCNLRIKAKPEGDAKTLDTEMSNISQDNVAAIQFHSVWFNDDLRKTYKLNATTHGKTLRKSAFG